MKVISITWSYDNNLIYKDSYLYKSFVNTNNKKNFLNIHFNRNHYLELEKKFEYKFGFQYEYILYKIFLFKNIVETIDDDNIIYSDTNDVACIGDISLLDKFIHDESVLFSAEANQYPSAGKLWNLYSLNNNLFLNSGLFIGSRYNIIKLLNKSIEYILPLEYKDFGGDQGVYTYNYINFNNIVLDFNNNIFLSTYLRSPNDYDFQDNRIICKKYNTKPIFIHDNGWNYGSPKFIEKFNLLNA